MSSLTHVKKGNVMIKRWDAYRGCNTTIEAIAVECSDGEWVKWSDIKKLFGVYDEDDMDQRLFNKNKKMEATNE